MSSRRFYYWRELLFMLLMFAVLLADLTYFNVLPPLGDEAAETTATQVAP